MSECVKEYRNAGIGGKLLDYAVKQIIDMGYREISIGVDQDNVSALHLYRKKGFTHELFFGEDAQGKYYKLMKVLP